MDRGRRRRCLDAVPGAYAGMIARAGAALLVVFWGCSAREVPSLPVPPGALAFGVFGDGPYSRADGPRYRVVLGELDASDVQWLVHVGDILSGPCTDAVLQARATEFRALRPAVAYTPGDNEWTDCHKRPHGRFMPLERLAAIRATFFPVPGQTLGRTAFPVEVQGADPAWPEVVENVRWRRGRVLFATLHVVGSAGGREPFPERTPADDSAATRRMDAALAWMEQAFAVAARDTLRAMVLAFHANPGFGRRQGPRPGYETFVPRLRELAGGYPGHVLVIHGDSHQYRFDQPLDDPRTRRPLPNVQRLETFGSPDIGWVRVVIDTVGGAILSVEPHRILTWRVP